MSKESCANCTIHVTLSIGSRPRRAFLTLVSMADTTMTCPNCGAAARGKFCSECGAALAGGKCATCQADLTPGAKFCHKCGTPVGTAAPGAKRPSESPTVSVRAAPPATSAAAVAPWAVAGVAIVALFALVAVNRFSSAPAAPANAMGNAPFAGGAGGAGAVDISSMSPEERAQRLFNRVMRLQSENKMDSVQFFAPMALDAYFALPSLDDDSRYDIGRIAEAVGAFPLAKAQADTILQASPSDLLGLALAMRVARETKDTRAAGELAKRLLAAAPKERKKDNAGYKAHAADLDLALKEAAR